MKRNLIIALAAAMHVTNSYAVLIPAATASNAYVFKKDYEDMFKDNEGRKMTTRNRNGASYASKSTGSTQDKDKKTEGELADDEDLRANRSSKTSSGNTVAAIAPGGNDSPAGSGDTGSSGGP